jgi:hypothetical protein
LSDRREDDGPFSVWDGDDMTMELMTDLNDGDVDEEVGVILSFSLHINFIIPTLDGHSPQ